MDQRLIQTKLNEEIAKFQKTMDELRLLKAATLDLRKCKQMILYRKYD